MPRLGRRSIEKVGRSGQGGANQTTHSYVATHRIDIDIAHCCSLTEHTEPQQLDGAQHAKPAKIINSVDEHEEDLEDEALVLITSAHLDHEEEDAEVVKAETFLYLLLGEVLAGHPLVDFTAHDLSMHLI